MLYPKLEEKLFHARQALERASGENLIELCKQYLGLLAEYRSELYKLPGTPGINQWVASPLSVEEIDATRKAVRVAIEHTTRERNRTAELLRSFTAVSGYEAVETLNEHKYRGHDDWVLRAGGVKFSDGIDSDRLTIQEAVDMTSQLRREEYVKRGLGGRDSNNTACSENARPETT